MAHNINCESGENSAFSTLSMQLNMCRTSELRASLTVSRLPLMMAMYAHEGENRELEPKMLSPQLYVDRVVVVKSEPATDMVSNLIFQWPYSQGNCLNPVQLRDDSFEG